MCVKIGFSLEARNKLRKQFLTEAHLTLGDVLTLERPILARFRITIQDCSLERKHLIVLHSFRLAILFLPFPRCLCLKRMKTIERNVGRSSAEVEIWGITPACRSGMIAISILSKQRTATFRITAAYRIYIQLHVTWTAAAKLVYQYLVERERSEAKKLWERCARGHLFIRHTIAAITLLLSSSEKYLRARPSSDLRLRTRRLFRNSKTRFL